MVKPKTSFKFRYTSFNKRLSQLRVDLIHTNLKQFRAEGDEESQFLSCLEKYRDLDKTLDFENFLRSLPPWKTISSLPQILLNKDKLISELLDAMEKSSELSLPSFFDVCSALVSDIRHEFYGEFWRFYRIICVHLQKSQDADVVERGFTTLTYMFRYLWRTLLSEQNFHDTFSHLFDLLSNQKGYIKRFAGEAASFLVRKIAADDYDKFLQTCAETVAHDARHSGGIGELIFQSMRGVGKTFHSCAEIMFANCLVFFAKIDDRKRAMGFGSILEAITERLVKFVGSGVHRGDRFFVESILSALEQADASFRDPGTAASRAEQSVTIGSEDVGRTDTMDDSPEENRCVKPTEVSSVVKDVYLKTLCKMLDIWISYNSGALIFSLSGLISRLTSIASDSQIQGQLSFICVSAGAMMASRCHEIDPAAIEAYVRAVLLMQHAGMTSEIFSRLLEFVKSLAKMDVAKFTTAVWPVTSEWAVKMFRSPRLRHVMPNLLDFLCRLLSKLFAISEHSKNFADLLTFKEFDSEILSLAQSQDGIEELEKKLALSALFLARYSDSVGAVDVKNWMQKTFDKVAIQQDVCYYESCLLLYDLQIWSRKSFPVGDLEMFNLANISAVLARNSRSKHFLMFLNLYLQLRPSALPEAQVHQTYEIVLPIFWLECRQTASEAVKLSQRMFITQPEIHEAFQSIITADGAALDPLNFREKIRLLKRVAISEISEENSWLKVAILRYLLGCFYTNFAPIWPALSEMISEMARGGIKDFVLEVLQFLSEVTVRIRNGVSNSTTAGINDYETEELENTTKNETPDHGNVRFQVLKLLKGHTHEVEAVHRQFVPIFLDFVRGEYQNIDHLFNLATEITQSGDEALAEAGHDTHSRQELSRVAKKTLIAFLNILSQFRNLRGLYQSPSVTSVLDALLCSNNVSIQSAALSVYMAYKYSWLGPYKESVLRLVSPKEFSDQVVDFSLELNDVKESDRHTLSKLVLRLLFGQLLNRSERRKWGVRARRMLIFGFLSSCNPDELNFFIMELVLKPLAPWLTVDLPTAVEIVLNRANEGEIPIPARRLLGLLSCLDIALDNLSHVLQELTPKLLQALLVMGVFLTKFGSTVNLKVVRRSVFQQLLHFCQAFDSYQWSGEEKGCLLKNVLSPACSNIHQDAVYAPTPVLKVLVHMSQKEDFLEVITGGERPLLLALIELILNPACTHASQVETIRVLNNLVSLTDASLLKPQADKLTKHIKGRILSNSAAGSRVSLSDEEVDLLISLADLSASAEDAKEMLESILQNLVLIFLSRSDNKKKESDEPTTKQLHLAVKLAEISHYYPPPSICELLFHIRDRAARSLLPDIVSAGDPKLGKILAQMDAFHPSRVEEPDFEARLEGISSAKARLHERVCGAWEAMIYTNMAAYHLSVAEDPSLRDGFSFLLQQILEHCSACFDPQSEPSLSDFKSRILVLIKLGLSAKSEPVRVEFLTILRTYCLTFPEDSKIAAIAQILKDPDDNFLSSLCHIQIPKRAAALRRFEVSANNAQFCLDFIQPFVMPFLQSAEYAKQNVLHDDVIGFLAKVYSCVGWKRYLLFLQQCISRLKKAEDRKAVKLQVKVTCGILGAYHFTTPESRPVAVMREKMLPSLIAMIMSDSGVVHRKSQAAANAREPYDQELAKSPLILALIKVLKVLPPSLTEQHLPTLISKLCYLLRSPFHDVRELSRKNLVAIVRLLGSRYLEYVLRELQALLTRGFHVDVMLSSVNLLIGQLEDILKPGDLDRVLSDLLSLTNRQIFPKSEFTDSENLAVKVSEKKSTKAVLTYRILGQFASEASVPALLANIRYLTQGSYQQHTELRLMERMCSLMAEGLSINAGLPSTALLTFALSILVDIQEFEAAKQKEEERKAQIAARKPDSLLIEKAPKRSGATPAKAKWTLNHVLQEFAIGILLQAFKKRGFDRHNPDHVALLNPFVPHLLEGLKSKHVKIITLCLRALSLLVPFPLKNVVANGQEIFGRLLVLMNNWAGVDSSTGQNDVMELCLALFKTCTTAIRELQDELSVKQVRVMLQYVEQVLLDSQKSHAGFPLLRALVARKELKNCPKSSSLNDLAASRKRRKGGAKDEKEERSAEIAGRELVDLLNRLREQMIKSLSDQYRSNARVTIVNFLKNQDSEVKVEYLIYFLVQLGYDEEIGRRAALEIIHEILSLDDCQFPDSVCMQVILHLSAFSCNEPSEVCRKMAYVVLKLTLGLVSSGLRQEIQTTSVGWLSSEPDKIRTGVLLLKILTELKAIAEGSMPTVVEACAGVCERASDETIVFLTLNLLLTIVNVYAKSLNAGTLGMLLKPAIDALKHPFSWARFQALKILNALEQEKCAAALESRIPELLDGLCMVIEWLESEDQLCAEFIDFSSVLTPILIENRLFVDFANRWVKMCLPEVRGHAKSTIRRLALFRWTARILPTIPHQSQEDLLESTSGLLFRELLITQGFDEHLKSVANELGRVVKKLIGSEDYAQLTTKHHKSVLTKRRKRKADAAITNINEPEKMKKRHRKVDNFVKQ